MELKLNTEVGVLTGIFESWPVNVYQDMWVAWFKEKPHIIVEADSLHEAIDELYISLRVLVQYESDVKNGLIEQVEVA